MVGKRVMVKQELASGFAGRYGTVVDERRGSHAVSVQLDNWEKGTPLGFALSELVEAPAMPSPERRAAQVKHDVGPIRELIRDAIGTCINRNKEHSVLVLGDVLSLLEQIQERFDRLHPRV